MAGALGGNKYVNGAALIRHPVVSEVDKFCNALGGKKPIYSILITHNGMAAIKFYQNKNLPKFVLIYYVVLSTPYLLKT